MKVYLIFILKIESIIIERLFRNECEGGSSNMTWNIKFEI